MLTPSSLLSTDSNASQGQISSTGLEAEKNDSRQATQQPRTGVPAESSSKTAAAVPGELFPPNGVQGPQKIFAHNLADVFLAVAALEEPAGNLRQVGRAAQTFGVGARGPKGSFPHGSCDPPNAVA